MTTEAKRIILLITVFISICFLISLCSHFDYSSKPQTIENKQKLKSDWIFSHLDTGLNGEPIACFRTSSISLQSKDRQVIPVYSNCANQKNLKTRIENLEKQGIECPEEKAALRLLNNKLNTLK